jgi:hypothetical protein
MRTTLNINIPTPCNEDWNDMTSEQKGRHCKSCEKTVFDFTSRTDEQIIKTFQSQNHICGRFKPSQLDRDLVLNRKEKNTYTAYLASSLFAVLSFNTMDIEAQAKPKVTTVEPSYTNALTQKIAIYTLDKTISGTITDDYDGQPVFGVNVVIKGTKIGVQTDFDGHYTLKIKKVDTIVFSYLGYETKQVKVTKSSTYDIKYKASDIDIMGKVMIYDPKIDKPHNKNKSQNPHKKERSKAEQLLYKMKTFFKTKN